MSAATHLRHDSERRALCGARGVVCVAVSGYRVAADKEASRWCRRCRAALERFDKAHPEAAAFRAMMGARDGA